MDRVEAMFDIVEENIILSKEEIIEYNIKIKNHTNTMYDLKNMTKLSKEEIINYINSYTLPPLPQYNEAKLITVSEINNILENRNIENTTNREILPKGIIIKRSNLRSFPTDLHFYSQKGVEQFDNLQETALEINTPVLIIHESKDQNWNFVISPTYAGWVKKENIAYATDMDWKKFIETPSFIVITEASIEIEDTILDMGVKLPYIGGFNEDYKVLIPTKKQNNFVTGKIIYISKEKTHIGYLPYTKKNIITEALKYKGTKYSWGGMDYNVDCSSFVSNVYKTFGFEFPRNTWSQRTSIGNTISLENKTETEKLEILDKNIFPALLYMPKHVLLYLGSNEKKHYVIHASSQENVVITNLSENNPYLANINWLIIVS